MRRLHRSPAFIGLACLAFFAISVGGVHRHLCLDGGEAPSSLHVGDAGVHHLDDEGGSAHNDVDLSPAEDWLAKKPTSSYGAPAVLPVAFLLLLTPVAIVSRTPPEPAPAVALAVNSAVVPPLRAPPA